MGVAENTWSTFRVQGQIYHKLGSLLPLENEPHQFMQIYFISDTTEQLDRRMHLFSNLDQRIVREWQEEFLMCNDLYLRFKNGLDQMPDDRYQIRIRADMTPLNEHDRRFNAPTVDEVGIVMIGESQKRDIVIKRRDHRLIHIDETHRFYDALQYPIIFSRGDESYNINLKRYDPVNRTYTDRNLSAMDYYAHQFMIRCGQKDFVLKCRGLLNQYAVDMYAKIEAERLRFIRLNQSTSQILWSLWRRHRSTNYIAIYVHR